jgi:hypothetical protein
MTNTVTESLPGTSIIPHFFHFFKGCESLPGRNGATKRVFALGAKLWMPVATPSPAACLPDSRL